MQFALLLLQLVQYLPSIIAAAEVLHGPKAGSGVQKLATTVQLLTAIVPDLAPHLTDDPKKLAVVHQVVGIAVAAMNASGTMPKAAVPVTPVADAG